MREQRENLIREGPDQLTYSHLAASYYPLEIKDSELFIAYDKPWDEDFQDMFGTPAKVTSFLSADPRPQGFFPVGGYGLPRHRLPFVGLFIWPDWECLCRGLILSSLPPFVFFWAPTVLFLPFLRFGKIDGKDCGKLMTYGAIQFGLSRTHAT